MAFKNNFKPDIIVGNPPYNNGMDIDFLIDAHRVAKIGTSFIVPAKWQTAEADQRIDSKHSYGDFRREVVPHMSKVVFYPDAAEIFEIRNVDGIVWYFAYSNKEIENCEIVNINMHQKWFNSIAKRNIKNRETLHNIGSTILNQLGKNESFEFQANKEQYRYQVRTGNQINGGCGWGYSNRENPCSLVNLDGGFKCIGSSVIIDTEKGETDTRGASTCTFGSNNIKECEIFVSWLDTKLVRFLIAINIGKLTGIFTNDYFRFVPKPFKGFSEIYTDKEMYEHYNISNEHINAIESIILDR